VTFKIRSSAGSPENLQRLGNKADHVDLGFVYDGETGGSNDVKLYTLGSVAYQPMMIFYRDTAPMRLLSDLAGKIACGVIVGDLATDNDAQRLRGHGAPVVQVTTDGRCHLEANMVSAAAEELGLDGMRLLIIENVGNLVCPSAHDLGEDLRVVMLLVTEGEDKPLKYPTMFKTAEIVVVRVPVGSVL